MKRFISAYSCSLDPTIILLSLPAVKDDNTTVVISNITQSAHSCYKKQYGSTHPSFAATAQHLLGNPLSQYLNATTNTTNQAIIDTGATSFPITDSADVEKNAS
jgi:hypothetical protein